VTHHGLELTLPGLFLAWAVIALLYHLIAEPAPGQSFGDARTPPPAPAAR
jgi:hypothetical protein